MKQRIYRKLFLGCTYNDTDCIVCFVFSYNRTIHDQKEEGMAGRGRIHFCTSGKQGDADVAFQAAAGKTDFRITLIAGKWYGVV